MNNCVAAQILQTVCKRIEVKEPHQSNALFNRLLSQGL